MTSFAKIKELEANIKTIKFMLSKIVEIVLDIINLNLLLII